MSGRRADAFEARLRALMEDGARWPAGAATFVLAYSGGSDSQALLHALLALKEAGSPPHWAASDLILAHFEHGWRGAEAAARERARLEALADELGLPLEWCDYAALRERLPEAALPADARGETAARTCRLAFLHALRADCARRGGRPCYLIFAHQAEDRVETLLMNLFRGCGLEGLSAMPPRAGWVLRPLIDLPKEAILAYLARRGLSFCDDPSNREPFTRRNRLRLSLLPALRAEFPRLDEHVLACAGQLGALREQLIEPRLARLGAALRLKFWYLNADAPLGLEVEKEALRDWLPCDWPPLLKVLLSALGESARDLGSGHHAQWAAALKAADFGLLPFIRGTVLAFDGRALRLWRSAFWTVLDGPCFLAARRGGLPRPEGEELALQGAGATAAEGPGAAEGEAAARAAEAAAGALGNRAAPGGLCLAPEGWQAPQAPPCLIENAGALGYNSLAWLRGLPDASDRLWRLRRAGDFVRLKQGRRKSLKKLMSELRIPAELRERCLLMASGDEVLCLPGYFRLEAERNASEREATEIGDAKHGKTSGRAAHHQG